MLRLFLLCMYNKELELYIVRNYCTPKNNANTTSFHFVLLRLLLLIAAIIFGFIIIFIF